MSIKQEVLSYLYINNNNFISGTQIAKNLSVTRNSIWKAIKALEADGYNIESVHNRGYKLIINTDILCKHGVDYYLTLYKNSFFKIEYFNSICSTSVMLKAFVDDYISNNFILDLPEGKVFLASYQTHGKGRLNREFFSPANTGVYFSILLKPNISPQDSILITILSSIAVCEAIQDLVKNSDKSQIKPQIKWVNDIFISEKKIGGILTEASLTLENLEINYIVLGIGLNVYKPKDEFYFPESIKNTAGYIFEDYQECNILDFKNKLVAGILSKFYDYYKDLGNLDEKSKKLILKKYSKLSCILNKNVIINTGVDAGKEVKVIGINNDFSLLVEFSCGKTKSLVCGEVSLKINTNTNTNTNV